MDKEEMSQKYKTYRPKIISESLNKFSRYHDAADLLIERWAGTSPTSRAPQDKTWGG